MQNISNSVTVDQQNCGDLVWHFEYYKDDGVPATNWV